MPGFLSGKKSYGNGIISVIAGIALAVTGDSTGYVMIFTGLGWIFGRQAITKATKVASDAAAKTTQIVAEVQKVAGTAPDLRTAKDVSPAKNLSVKIDGSEVARGHVGR